MFSESEATEIFHGFDRKPVCRIGYFMFYMSLCHKSPGPFICIHASDYQVADKKDCYGHANNV